MILHLVELPIAMRALHHWAGRRLPSPDLDEGVALHHLLAETFGPAVLQPFRLMVAPGHGTVAFTLMQPLMQKPSATQLAQV